jgi:hypothetical protein
VREHYGAFLKKKSKRSVHALTRVRGNTDPVHRVAYHVHWRTLDKPPTPPPCAPRNRSNSSTTLQPTPPCIPLGFLYEPSNPYAVPICTTHLASVSHIPSTPALHPQSNIPFAEKQRYPGLPCAQPTVSVRLYHAYLNIASSQLLQHCTLPNATPALSKPFLRPAHFPITYGA